MGESGWGQRSIGIFKVGINKGMSYIWHFVTGFEKNISSAYFSDCEGYLLPWGGLFVAITQIGVFLFKDVVAFPLDAQLHLKGGSAIVLLAYQHEIFNFELLEGDLTFVGAILALYSGLGESIVAGAVEFLLLGLVEESEGRTPLHAVLALTIRILGEKDIFVRMADGEESSMLLDGYLWGLLLGLPGSEGLHF